jgi:hypothetical protein
MAPQTVTNVSAKAGISIFREEVYNTEYISVVLFLSFLFNFSSNQSRYTVFLQVIRLNPFPEKFIEKNIP